MTDLRLYAMIDSCGFIEQLLEQGKHDLYHNKISDLIEHENIQMVICPIIDYEVVDKIIKTVKEMDCEKNSSTIYYGQKNECQEYTRLLFNYKSLLEKYQCKMLLPERNFNEILEMCYAKLRLGGSVDETDRDRLILAIAISNGCKYFITGDEKIKDEQETLNKYFNNSIKIIYIESYH
ncbi:MAG: hypothetical protein Q8N99_02445 [Nanoarchaeota archaeon]|nr:hypothetical protein [Nanoarchaeota archaeon]